MKLAILGGGGVRIPMFIHGVLSRPGASFGEICLFEPDQARRETIGRLSVEVAAALGHRGVVRVTADVEDAFTGADFVFSAIRVGGDRPGRAAQGHRSHSRVPVPLALPAGHRRMPPGHSAAARTAPPAQRRVPRRPGGRRDRSLPVTRSWI